MHDHSPGQLLSNINTRPLHWLWPQRIPFAHLTILYGQPGSGLSLIALHLAACVSSGRTLPDDLPCPQGNVILIAPFDIPAYTIKPRLENAAADTSHILLLNTIPIPSTTTPPAPDLSSTPYYNPREFSNSSFSNPPIPDSSPSSASTIERPFSLAHDLAHLEHAIQRTSARLVIIDSSDICHDQLMRPLLPRLTHLARNTDSAILLIRSLNRPLPIPLRSTFLHTFPLISSVHSALLLIPDPEDDQERLLITIKHSLSTPTPVLSCSISPQPSGIPIIQWLGEHTDSVISSSSSAGTESVRSMLRQFILDTLQDSLQDSPEPFTAQELSQFLPYEYDNIRKTLQRMVHSGELISPARGLYTLPPSSTTTSVPTVPTVPTVPIVLD
ncbi:MAG: AAA family ATPase [Ktedonobacteraceae bacterium]